MQTPLQLDIWLKNYEGFVNAKNNIKQRNLNAVFANISKTASPTSDSFLLIMSHMIVNRRRVTIDDSLIHKSSHTIELVIMIIQIMLICSLSSVAGGRWVHWQVGALTVPEKN